MAETFVIPTSHNKVEKYQTLMPQIKALTVGEPDFIANLANIAAALKVGMNFFWVGFYLVKNTAASESLVLGPFQGPVACTRIAKNKGVCGKSWATKEVIVVEDVEQFPGHIACSADSKSEIVLPAKDKNGIVFLVLDVDSNVLADFDETDKKYLSELILWIEELKKNEN